MTNSPDIPDAKFLPDMIHDHEVPALMVNDQNAQESIVRREELEDRRANLNRILKTVGIGGAIGAATVALVVSGMPHKPSAERGRSITPAPAYNPNLKPSGIDQKEIAHEVVEMYKNGD
jgi:hypothetical protein